MSELEQFDDPRELEMLRVIEQAALEERDWRAAAKLVELIHRERQRREKAELEAAFPGRAGRTTLGKARAPDRILRRVVNSDDVA